MNRRARPARHSGTPYAATKHLPGEADGVLGGLAGREVRDLRHRFIIRVDVSPDHLGQAIARYAGRRHTRMAQLRQSAPKQK